MAKTAQNASIKYKDVPLFKGIAPENLDALLFCMRSYVHSYKKGEHIRLRNEKGQHVGIVLKGAVHMIKTDVWGNDTLLTYMSEGEIFGESLAAQKEEDSDSYVTFLASAAAEVLFLSFDKAIHVCKNRCVFHYQLIENLFDLIGRKNQQLMEKIEVTSQGSLREKILAYLSMQAQKQNSRYVTLSLSRTDMAQFLCTNRSAMTRELSNLREEGVIDFEKNTFVLKK